MKGTVLEAAVEDLAGKSSDEIAELMRQYGVKGRPGTTTCCPLANLLHEVYGGYYIVGPKCIMKRTSHNRLEKMETPTRLAAFVRKFDQMKYPDLIAPPPRMEPKTPRTRRGASRPHVVKNHPSKEVGRWKSE